PDSLARAEERKEERGPVVGAEEGRGQRRFDRPREPPCRVVAENEGEDAYARDEHDGSPVEPPQPDDLLTPLAQRLDDLRTDVAQRAVALAERVDDVRIELLPRLSHD